MALTIRNKYETSLGYICWVGTDQADSVNNKDRFKIIEIRVNKVFYNALGAGGQSDIGSNFSWTNINNPPFS